jgi:hypothetical protein
MKVSTSKYRFESGSAYEFSATQNAYGFIGKLNGRSKVKFIREYEAEQFSDDEICYDDNY